MLLALKSIPDDVFISTILQYMLESKKRKEKKNSSATAKLLGLCCQRLLDGNKYI